MHKCDIHRPAGLIVVIVVTGVFAAFGLILSGLALLAVAAGKATFGEAVIVLATFALSVAEAVLCFGLWLREDWGVSLAKWVFGLSIFLGVITVFMCETAGEALLQLAGIGVYIWMLAYVVALDGRAPTTSKAAPGNGDRDFQPRADHFR